jgi:ribosomal protein S18 acetylase RimI-like enzyme
MDRSCTVRPATEDDVAAMLGLLAQLFGIEQDFCIDHQCQAAGLELLLGDTERCCVLVAESDSSVVGMLTGQLVVSTAAGGFSLLVEDLVVDERRRRRGIGRRLIEALDAWGLQKGALRMQLVADETNAAALHFYEKQSWRRGRMVALYKP